jgi:trimethylamine--corrinoid protein Co-methyltransferase
MISQVDAEQIHETSLRLLADPGVRLEHERVCRLLLKAGAEPGMGAHTVRLPAEMVADALARAPSDIRFADRAGGGYSITSRMAASRVWSTPGMNIERGGKVRPLTRADMAGYARLLGRLPRVDGVFGVSLADAPPASADVIGLQTMAANTTKHIRVLCASPASADVMCRMKPVLGDMPWFSIGFTAHGPLRWTHLALEIFVRTAGHGIPTTINGEPMAGASGPVTLAGAAAVGNAEILAGLVVNQLLEPGRPCVYNLGLAHVMDMQTGEAVTGGPENHLLACISAAMGQFYNLPSCSWVSTEAMLPDAQAALEKSLGWKTHLDAGVGLIWGVGQLESELTVSPAMAWIDHEILAYIDRLRRGVTIDSETLAEEVTRSVGIAGEFLSHEHTLKHFRQELYEPQLLWRGKRVIWESHGGQTLTGRAEEQVSKLMSPLDEPLLSDDEAEELNRLTAAVQEDT